MKALAGENVGVLLRSVRISVVQRGMILCAAGTEKISNHFDASLYLLHRNEGGRSKPIASKYIQQLFSRTWNVPARIDLSKLNYLIFYLFNLFSPKRLYSCNLLILQITNSAYH